MCTYVSGQTDNQKQRKTTVRRLQRQRDGASWPAGPSVHVRCTLMLDLLRCGLIAPLTCKLPVGYVNCRPPPVPSAPALLAL